MVLENKTITHSLKYDPFFEILLLRDKDFLKKYSGLEILEGFS